MQTAESLFSRRERQYFPSRSRVLLNPQEAGFLETPRSLTRNAAFLRGQAWPRPSSPGQRPPWGQRAASLIRGCLKPFLEFSKDKRLCQHPRSPERVRRLPGTSAWEGAGDPGAAATMPTQPCDRGGGIGPQSGCSLSPCEGFPGI